ncbi:MAG TPA: carboxymuconolactone decarboxylase family protein [Flavisolibacter sp.]
MMKPFIVPAKEQVTEETQAIFDQLQKRLGKVPNLYATMGYSAHALKTFLAFEEGLNKGSFNAKEREAIALVVSQVNDCAYCLAAHTAAALQRGFKKEETFLIRNGVATDAKLNTVLKLAKSIAENKGNAEETEVEDFFNAGYNEAAMMELIGLIAVRIFTNYVYTLTNIPVDFPAADPLPKLALA